MSYASQPSQKKRKFSIMKFRPYKPTPTTGKPYTKRNMAAVAAQLGVESKYIDNLMVSGTVSTALAGSEQDPATPLCLNSMGTGDEPTNRNGRKIHMTSFQMKGHFLMSPIEDQPTAWIAPAVRLIIYVDHQTNGAQANAEDVLDDTAGTDVCALRNVEYEKRFTVLYDQQFMIPLNSFNDAAATGTVSGGAVPFSIYKKLNFDTTFTDANATVASIVDNSVHVMALSSTSNVKLHYQSRCRFVG